MPKLKNKNFDICVIGSGLAGLTAANGLAKIGYSVLLIEQHYQYGGLAAFFRRPGGYTFDVSLHGFPFGMVKSCRKYWNSDIANSIIQLPHIRFVNPQFNIETTFDRKDFTDKLINIFHISPSVVEKFFMHLRGMNFYDNDNRTTGELFEEFFPGRSDVHRLLMEPITYANGSTLDDPAITYGIVFSNFMSKGVYTFSGGTDKLIKAMLDELKNNKVTTINNSKVSKIFTDKNNDNSKVVGLEVNGETVSCKAIVSNANLKSTILELLDKDAISDDFKKQTNLVRLNNSSCQVYIGLKENEHIDDIGDLIFTSTCRDFSSSELKKFGTESRTFSVYYPKIRPDFKPRYTIVASTNAYWKDWSKFNSEEEYKINKERLKTQTIQALDKFIPNVESKIGWIEVSTPITFNRYTGHLEGASFGTKFEGLKISMELPNVLNGLYHSGSVGIIMSGWLGTINYGMITVDKVDKYLRTNFGYFK